MLSYVVFKKISKMQSHPDVKIKLKNRSPTSLESVSSRIGFKQGKTVLDTLRRFDKITPRHVTAAYPRLRSVPRDNVVSSTGALLEKWAIDATPRFPLSIHHVQNDGHFSVPLCPSMRDDGFSSRIAVFACGFSNKKQSGVYKLNLRNQLWRPVEPLPEAIIPIGLVQVKSRVFAVGGDESFSWDIIREQWTTAKGPLIPRRDAGLTRLDDRICLVGGQDDTGCPRSEVEFYDPYYNAWALGPALPEANFQMGVTTYKNQVWVVGGGSLVSPTPKVLAFDPRQGFWSAKHPMGACRTCCQLVSTKDDLYVLGGLIPTGKGQEVVCSSTIRMYEDRVDKWLEGGHLVTARFSFCGTSAEGKVFVGGGKNADGDYVVDLEMIYPGRRNRVISCSCFKTISSLCTVDFTL